MGKSRRRSSSEGARLVAEFRRSGLSQRRFAGQAGVKVAALQYWLRKDQAGGDSVPPAQFKFVEVLGGGSKVAVSGGMSMELSGGLMFRFEGLPSPTYLSQLATAFAKSSRC